MQIEFTVHIWKEGDQFIAHALPLDVASSGPTPEASRQALDEAVQLFIKTAEEHGTLEEVLEEAGYEREREEWRSPSWVAVERRIATVSI
jgi:predicted RNase H-like HicB family nuclease